MSLNWIRLAQEDRGNGCATPPAVRSSIVKRRQRLDESDPIVHGAIAGSAPDLGRYSMFEFPELGGEVLCRRADDGAGERGRPTGGGAAKTPSRGAGMSDFSVMILCGRSPRHLHVANRLCQRRAPLAIVQETGSDRQRRSRSTARAANVPGARLAVAARPAPLRRQRRGPVLLRRRTRRGSSAPTCGSKCRTSIIPMSSSSPIGSSPDLIAVFGTSLITGRCWSRGGSESSISTAASRPTIAGPTAHSGRSTTASPSRSGARCTASTRASTRAPDRAHLPRGPARRRRADAVLAGRTR